MNFKTFLSDPKVMAASGLITLFLKSTLCISVSMLIYFLKELPALNPNLNWISYPLLIVFILYPLTALTVDLLLYLNKKKIWRWPLDLSAIPTDWIDWNMTPEAFLNYASMDLKFV